MPEVRWTHRADRDLGRILQYLQSVRPASTSIVLEHLLDGASDLGSNPELGFVSKRTDDATVREYVVRPYYSLLYRHNGDVLHVLRVWDGRRDPAEFFVDPAD
jgi:plasmid stabilization system protein ParE